MGGAGAGTRVRGRIQAERNSRTQLINGISEACKTKVRLIQVRA